MSLEKTSSTVLTSETTEPSTSTEPNPLTHSSNRRSFLKNSMIAGAAATVGAGLMAKGIPAFAQETNPSTITKGDIDILRFLAAAEILETDLWQQYTELGGTQDSEESGVNGGSSLYMSALQILDADMSQYIHDNTDDEVSHQALINAYLESIGAEPVDLSQFANLPSSKASGARDLGRLTNLMNLTVDTSFWTRYRSATHNPDLDAGFKFASAETTVNRTAIPRADDDLNGPAHIAPFDVPDHLKAIAFTAGFHFCAIEQGGSSLYPSLAQRVNNVDVLRILLSIGPTETAHFQTWMDKAGNVLTVSDVDPVTKSKVTFQQLSTNRPESLQSNLIMPEPCPFLSRKFPACSIVRPTNTAGAAMGAVKSLTADGLFIGQSPEFFSTLTALAAAADAAQRGF
ncbi:MAG: ferritin-like domain-containing protein [Candidatus Sulfotelmatobacter sp.]